MRIVSSVSNLTFTRGHWDKIVLGANIWLCAPEIIFCNNYKMAYKPVTHVIFDMDGLLLDSESGYDKIMDGIAKQFGKEYTQDVRMKVLGTPEKDTAKICITEMDLPLTSEEFIDQYHQGIQRELKNPPLLPGAAKLIKHFHKHNIPIALATSSTYDGMLLKTQNHKELFDLLLHKVCGSTDPEVKNGKPSPDIFLVCASRFTDKPLSNKCLVFEDAPNGVTGAIAAGMQAVMVPHKDVAQELRKHATLVLESLEDFKPELFGLPAFN